MKINNQEITTVVSDFDGTILKLGMHEPSDHFFKVVKKLLKQNIQFIAASGRQYPNLKRILEPIADQVGFIAENGALIMWKGKVLHKSTMDRELAMEVIKDMQKQPNSEILVSGEGTSYIVPNDPHFAYLLEHQTKNIITILKDFSEIKEEILKVSIWYSEGIPQMADKAFREKYDQRLLVVESGNGWLDFMHKESGKGAALSILAKETGLDLSQTVSFGDSENDISMLQTTQIGYAMNSAKKQVKEAADFTCESVEDTLWEAITNSN